MKKNNPTPQPGAPTLPLPGEGVKKSHAPNSFPLSGEAAKNSHNPNSSPCQGGGREGVALKKIFNPPTQTTKRRDLRKNSTEPERRLWAKIRNKQLGVKFRRQHGIGPYIADFYCAEYSLVIELDGDSHFTPQAQQYDHKRENFMRTLGLETLRFTNQDIIENSEGVLMMISEKIDTRKISP